MPVDRMPTREANIRMMAFLNSGHVRKALQGRLQEEAKG
jgi:hypothetical protein